ncbi:MAG: TonB-dependent receptor [Gemmatimonadota bacterium]|nr:TonB-dependent receptor [Gemmatimonadota bacterium]
MMTRDSDPRTLSRGKHRPFGRRVGLAPFLFFAFFAASSFFGSAGHAQETGQITGQVVEAATGAPLGQAQIFLTGTNMGALSRGDGRFLILNVPAGTHEIVAERIGHRTVRQQISVDPGASVQVSLEMEREALALDELVVTGQAGAARQREVGNAVSQLDVDELELSDRNVEEIMGGRVPGAVITEVSGQAGSGNMIRLRGINSIAMTNQPLVYVDGVRVRSEAYPKNVPPIGYSGRSGNVQASPLANINPESIDRVEVIKGAAATSLYGTEASAGVIQIFTKRGTSGSPQFSVGTSQSLRHMQKFGAENFEFEDTDGQVLGNSDFMYMDRHWLRNAWGQEYFGDVRGGLEDISYFLSGKLRDVNFPLVNDHEKAFSLRGNFQFSLGWDITADWNTSYLDERISNTPAGDNAQGVTLNAWRPSTSYTGAVPTRRENINALLDYEIFTDINHFTTGLTFRHALGDRLDQRLTVGFDRAYTEGQNFRPFGFILQPDGRRAVTRWVGETLTVDYAANYTQPLGSDWSTTFSAGGQLVETEETSTTGNADQFPNPGEATLSSGAVSLSFEERMRVINGGLFVQDRIGYQDRLFLTLGLRVDGNSAFGEGFGLQPYPKATMSYVVSDESFWSSDWGTLKLRAAFGQSGRAPGAFDAVRTWSPVKIAGASGFLPANPGNPELGPERTQEFEMGFDGSFLSDRLAVVFTFYDQTTTDALFPVRRAPSAGNWQSQLENVGELQNRGIELSLDGAVVQRSNFSWDVGLQLATHSSEVLDLGEAPEFSVGGEVFVREGHPAPVICGPRILNPDEFADPEYQEDFCWGATQPTLTLSPSMSFRLPLGVRVSARGEYLGGHFIEDSNTNGKIGRGESFWPSCIEIRQLFDSGRLDEITASERNRCLQQYERSGLPMNRGDFFKLRNLSVQIPLSFWTSVTNPTLTVSGRNVWKWLNDDWKVLGPEVGCNTGHSCLVINQQEHLPPATTWTASLRFGF